MYYSNLKTKKGYKIQKAKKTCSQCSREIDTKKDNFILQLNWKIKNNPDIRSFCSMKCLQKWIKED